MQSDGTAAGKEGTVDTKYLKRIALYIAAVLFSAAMVFYIGYHIYVGLTSDIKTEAASETSRSSVVRADAYIFRTEETVPRTGAGKLIPEAADSSHVAAGSAVAGIYTDSASADGELISTLKSQIKLLKSYSSADRGAKNAAEIDKRIYAVMTQIKNLVKRNDYAGISEMKSELLAEMNEREAVSGSGDGDTDALIASLEAQLEAERAKLGRPLETVYAPRSGWYYSEADGFENIFTPEALDTLTLGGYDSLISSAPADTGNTAGKLVTDYIWYITARIDAKTASGMTEGEDYDVSFAYSGGKVIPMTLERIITETGADSAVLVLSSGEIDSGFSFARHQTVDITVRVITGFAVPRSAVRLSDGVTGVYVFDGVRAHFRRIEVIKEFDDVYIVSSSVEEDEEAKNEEGYIPFLSRNELIITEGKGIYDGRVIS